MIHKRLPGPDMIQSDREPGLRSVEDEDVVGLEVSGAGLAVTSFKPARGSGRDADGCMDGLNVVYEVTRDRCNTIRPL